MDTKEIFEIILNYIIAIVSWPAVFLIVSLIFIFKFKESINSFLKNIASIKIGSLKVEGQAQNFKVDIKDQIKELEKGEEIQIKDQSERIKYLTKRSEIYEFAYISLFLVYNTKLALQWFYFQALNSSTKGNFVAQFSLPNQIANPLAEKEAIFNALLTNELLEQTGDLFKVSKKGIKFLRHIKLIT